MPLKVKEFEYVVNEFGLSELLFVRAYSDIEDTEIGLYEMANDRWGAIFEIDVPPLLSEKHEKALQSLFQTVFPEETSIQFFSFTSRNLKDFLHQYKEIHSFFPAHADADILEKIVSNRIKWVDDHRDSSVFSDKGYDFRIRNFVNLLVITIPKNNKAGLEFTETEVISTFSKAIPPMRPFNPRKYHANRYVSLMKELLMPEMDPTKAEVPEISSDEMELHKKLCTDNTIMIIDEKDSTIGIGTRLSREEYAEVLKKQNIRFRDPEEEEPEDTKDKPLLQRIFEKKKKVETRFDYTEYYAKTMTTKLYPEEIQPHMLVKSFLDETGNSFEAEVPSQFFTSLIVYIHPSENKEDSSLIEKRDWVGIENEITDDNKRYIPESAIEASNEAKKNHMSAMWSMAVIDKDKEHVKTYSKRIISRLKAQSWILQDETVIPQWVYLLSLPLQFEHFILKYTMRLNTIFSYDKQKIIPLISGDKGDRLPEHFFVDRMGQISSFTPLKEGGGSFILLGMEQSGKSYLIKDLSMNLMAAGLHSTILDIDNQYEEFSSTMGIDRQVISKKGISFDPFSLPRELTTAILFIFGSNYLKENFDATEEDIAHAVESSENLEEFAEIVSKKHPATSEFFNSLLPGGRNSQYFYGEKKLSWSTLDIFSLTSEEGELTDFELSFFALIIYMAAVSRIDRSFIVMDTKLDFFNPTLSYGLKKCFDIGKRKDHFMGIVARNPRSFTTKFADFFKNTDYQIILKIHSDITSGEFEQEMLNIFSQEDLQKIRSIKIKIPLYTEVLIKSKDKHPSLLRFFTDRVSHWFYTDFDNDLIQIESIAKEYNLSKRDARYLKGLSQRDKIPLEEAFIRFFANEQNKKNKEE